MTGHTRKPKTRTDKANEKRREAEAETPAMTRADALEMILSDLLDKSAEVVRAYRTTCPDYFDRFYPQLHLNANRLANAVKDVREALRSEGLYEAK
jgi:uncharacterized protein YukE